MDPNPSRSVASSFLNPPPIKTVVNPNKDRSLNGKKRIKARKAANKK